MSAKYLYVLFTCVSHLSVCHLLVDVSYLCVYLPVCVSSLHVSLPLVVGYQCVLVTCVCLLHMCLSVTCVHYLPM